MSEDELCHHLVINLNNLNDYGDNDCIMRLWNQFDNHSRFIPLWLQLRNKLEKEFE